MPIISDGNNEIGDSISDQHTVMGFTNHTGSYSITGDIYASGSLVSMSGFKQVKGSSTVDLSSGIVTSNTRSSVLVVTVDGNIPNNSMAFGFVRVQSNAITSDDVICTTSQTQGLTVEASGVNNGFFNMSFGNFTGNTLSDDSTFKVNWVAI